MAEDLKYEVEHDGKKQKEGKGISDSIVTINNFSFAYVIHSTKSSAQSNAVVLVAGEDADADVKNDLDLEKDDNS